PGLRQRPRHNKAARRRKAKQLTFDTDDVAGLLLCQRSSAEPDTPGELLGRSDYWGLVQGPGSPMNNALAREMRAIEMGGPICPGCVAISRPIKKRSALDASVFTKY